MTARNRSGLWLGGASAGVIAAVVMGLVTMIRAGMAGAGFWFPPKLIAGVFLGSDVIIGGAGVFLLGFLIHLITGAALGAIFGRMIPPRTSTVEALGLGVLYGAFVWALMTFFFLPLANPVMHARVFGLDPGWWFINHLIFGAALAITPALQNRFSRVEQIETIESRRIDRAA